MKKFIALLLVAVMCFSLGIGGTVAYLTDRETETNVFTVGDVDIELVDEFTQGSKLLPGVVLDKKISIKNVGSENAWVFYTYAVPTAIKGVVVTTFADSDNWEAVSELADTVDINGVNYTNFLVAHNKALGAGKTTDVSMLSVKLDPSVDAVDGEWATVVNGTVTKTGWPADKAPIVYVSAYAIQSDAEIDSIDEAISAYTTQWGGFNADYSLAQVTVLDENDTIIVKRENETKPVTILDEGLKIKAGAGSFGSVNGEINLDTAYQYEPLMSKEAGAVCEYKDWHADFVVSADKDVPENAIGLAGYYDLWCHGFNGDNWVVLAGPEVKAGTEIRLVDAMGGGSIVVPYNLLCEYGNDGIGFLCGAVALDKAAAAGTTLTVELRIYEVIDGEETGEFFTVGTRTYTFEPEGTAVSSDAELATAIADGATTVILSNDEYTMPEPDLRGKTLNIKGTKNTVIDMTAVDARDQFVTGAEIVFDGVTLNFGTANYMGLANTKSLTFKNCTINGLQFLYGENVTFENCTLNSNGAEHTVWTYGAKNVSFTNCDFTYGDRGINCYSDNDVEGGKQTVNFKNCTFTTENTASDGAVEINSTYFSVGIEVNMEGCTAPAYGKMAYVSPWDSTNGAKTTINIK